MAYPQAIDMKESFDNSPSADTTILLPKGHSDICILSISIPTNIEQLTITFCLSYCKCLLIGFPNYSPPPHLSIYQTENKVIFLKN